jgi:hypothetical protein
MAQACGEEKESRDHNLAERQELPALSWRAASQIVANSILVVSL